MYRSLDPADHDFDTLTHLCLAFAIDQGGSLGFNAEPEEIQALIDAAHEKGVYVLASIAGAAGGQAVEDAIQPDVVDAYVTQLLDLLETFDLDGIDVDIEGNHVGSTYEPFVIKLSDALPEGKLLTAAVATWNGADFSDGALAEYDFINLMSYDHCGSWS
jgi:GH18 family chitinase